MEVKFNTNMLIQMLEVYLPIEILH